MTTRFIAARDVWKLVTQKVRQSRRTFAAIAYLGRGGGKILPVRKGDTLVVDMSLGTVGHGATDPHEVAKLIKKGVLVCSRPGLHAKFVVTSNWLISGSMNASVNSRDVLAEAAILTNDESARALARKTIESWAVRPVTPGELKAAIDKYRPPKFPAARLPRKRRAGSPLSRVGALWLEGGLEWQDDEDSEADDRELRKAVKGKRRRTGFEFNSIGFNYPDRFSRQSRPGEWVIQVVEGEVLPPARVVGTRSYRRKGRMRAVVALEEREDWTSVRWAKFRSAVRRNTGKKLVNQRAVFTAPAADTIMSLWSAKSGRPLARKFNASSNRR